MRKDWAKIVARCELDRAAFVEVIDGWARTHLGRGWDPSPIDADAIGCVYVVQDSNSGCVKVGHSTALYARLDSLRLSRGTPDWPPAPRQLSLVAHTPGSVYLESQLLRLLQQLLIHPASEWLSDSPPTRALVVAFGGAAVLPARAKGAAHP